MVSQVMNSKNMFDLKAMKCIYLNWKIYFKKNKFLMTHRMPRHWP